MMAVVADTLIAAPFATVGSIGATTSVPVLNVGGFLRRVGIQAYAVKSGRSKLFFLLPPLPSSLPPPSPHTVKVATCILEVGWISFTSLNPPPSLLPSLPPFR